MMFIASVGVWGGARFYEALFHPIFPGENPAHPVTLTQPYYMGKFPVTQEQYQAVIGSNPSFFKHRDNPVELVSWNDAQAFCKTLSSQTQEFVRLPTEAEWEYACRAGTKTIYHSGDSEADWSRIASSSVATYPVGQKEPNAFGLYDMLGNVLQLCEDWYAEDYYGKSEIENPKGAAIGTHRVIRGGHYRSPPSRCRSAFRGGIGPDEGFNGVGFRVVVQAGKAG
jgi:formylglycine-generating enzyme required for sulfatase activity